MHMPLFHRRTMLVALYPSQVLGSDPTVLRDFAQAAEQLGYSRLVFAEHVLGADPNRPVMHLSTGNPHAVVGVEDVAVVPLKELGERVPMVNLEIIEPGPESNAITMRVHERGAGITQA